MAADAGPARADFASRVLRLSVEQENRVNWRTITATGLQIAADVISHTEDFLYAKFSGNLQASSQTTFEYGLDISKYVERWQQICTAGEADSQLVASPSPQRGLGSYLRERIWARLTEEPPTRRLLRSVYNERFLDVGCDKNLFSSADSDETVVARHCAELQDLVELDVVRFLFGEASLADFPSIVAHWKQATASNGAAARLGSTDAAVVAHAPQT